VMRAIRTIRRAEDMPLYGKVTRVKKHLYEVVIKFVVSKRVLHVEQIGAPNVTAVKLFFRREYPTIKWGKPRYSHVAKTPKPKKVKSDGKQAKVGKPKNA
jgi:hypothetical protein